MPTLEVLTTYFTSPLSLGVLGLSYALIAILSILFLKGLGQAKAKSRILTAIFFISLFIWVFVALSLAFCYLLYDVFIYDLGVGVKAAIGDILIGGFIVAIPVSFGLGRLLSSLMLRAIDYRHPVKGAIRERFELVSSRMRIKGVELLETGVEAPASFAINGRRKYVAISKFLFRLLDTDEIETIMAHELAHLKNGDIIMKTLASVYRVVLLFDPLIRLVEAAIYREREYLADETAASVTGKPVALASALLKIHEVYPQIPTKGSNTMAITERGRGLFSRHPSLEQRIDRLLRIAQSETVE